MFCMQEDETRNRDGGDYMEWRRSGSWADDGFWWRWQRQGLGSLVEAVVMLLLLLLFKDTSLVSSLSLFFFLLSVLFYFSPLSLFFRPIFFSLFLPCFLVLSIFNISLI